VQFVHGTPVGVGVAFPPPPPPLPLQAPLLIHSSPVFGTLLVQGSLFCVQNAAWKFVLTPPQVRLTRAPAV